MPATARAKTHHGVGGRLGSEVLLDFALLQLNEEGLAAIGIADCAEVVDHAADNCPLTLAVVSVGTQGDEADGVVEERIGPGRVVGADVFDVGEGPDRLLDGEVGSGVESSALIEGGLGEEPGGGLVALERGEGSTVLPTGSGKSALTNIGVRAAPPVAQGVMLARTWYWVRCDEILVVDAPELRHEGVGEEGVVGDHTGKGSAGTDVIGMGGNGDIQSQARVGLGERSEGSGEGGGAEGEGEEPRVDDGVSDAHEPRLEGGRGSGKVPGI
ncbi:MAG: hypothetical protein IPP47_06210 [Bryobacterales bacterium]|nr:hypothetical protein [Bryobacterales bacterium]